MEMPSARAMSLMPTGLAGGVGFRASEDMPSDLNSGTSGSKGVFALRTVQTPLTKLVSPKYSLPFSDHDQLIGLNGADRLRRAGRPADRQLR